MPEHRCEAVLGDCFTLVKDKADPASLDAALPYVGLEHIEPGRSRLGHVGQAGSVTSLVSVFQPGDVLFGRLRPYLRKVARADFVGVCSPEVLVLRPKPKVVPGFLHLLASSEAAIDHAVSLSAGSRMPRTSASDLASLPISLPSLPSQRRIVDLVGTLDAQIERLRLENAAASHLAQSIADSAWHVAAKEGQIKVLADATERIKNGVMYKRGDAAGGWPVTRIETISSGRIDLSRTGLAGFDQHNAAKFLLSAGDILFSNKNSLERVGTTAIVTDEVLPLVNGDNVLQVRPLEETNPG